MEILWQIITAFMVRQIVNVIENWSLRLRGLNNKIEECDSSAEVPEKAGECPLRPIAPSPDYLEAMLGDFLEWQTALQQQGVSTKRILLMTLLAFVGLMADVLAIMLNNLIVPMQSQPFSNSSSESSDVEESDEDVAY
ncbi:MAG: hypothetical protein AAF327_17500 [Cyanobacteria bacterium P01_A01_bin.37]